ncbi:hypothetical protein AB0L34_33120 [Micromonospora sp. NPDC052213]|uniref:hypothetical protein n=1 Tax=Micromonospora sp. NPDC052213 TaxID=3155812 RepID=UPI0034454190
MRTDVPWSEPTDGERQIVLDGPEEKKALLDVRWPLVASRSPRVALLAGTLARHPAGWIKRRLSGNKGGAGCAAQDT